MMVEKWITRGFIQASRYASISAKSIQHLSRVYVLLSIISSNDYNNIACYTLTNFVLTKSFSIIFNCLGLEIISMLTLKGKALSNEAFAL